MPENVFDRVRNAQIYWQVRKFMRNISRNLGLEKLNRKNDANHHEHFAGNKLFRSEQTT